MYYIFCVDFFHYRAIVNHLLWSTNGPENGIHSHQKLDDKRH